MRAFLVALLALGACKSEADMSPCSVSALASGGTGETFIDCGSFHLGDANYTIDAMAAAQACVLNAQSQSTSFLLVYDAEDANGVVTGNVAAGWVGNVDTDKHFVAREYAGEGRAGDMSMTSVSVTTCSTVTATASCTLAIGHPCLTCTALGLPSVACRH